MIKGIAARPTATEIYLLLGLGILNILPNIMRVNQHNRFMVIPGTTTEAKDCQTNASQAATKVFLLLASTSSQGAFKNKYYDY